MRFVSRAVRDGLGLPLSPRTKHAEQSVDFAEAKAQALEAGTERGKRFMGDSPVDHWAQGTCPTDSGCVLLR